MKISIIVPVYNVEQYIKESFDSIAAQSYKGEIECIFVDDCGQDNSVAVLEKLIAEYKGPIQFSIIHHEHNKGLSGARNTGIRKASGDYLYFLDSDDSITSDCIEKLVILAEKYPGVEIVQGSTKSRMEWLQMGWKKLPEYSDNFKWIKKNILKRIIFAMTAWNKLIKRSFVIEHGLYFLEGVIHEDDLWNFELAKYTKSIAICTSISYNYRENPNGIMNMSNSHESYIPVLKEMAMNITSPCTSNEIRCISLICGEHRGHLDIHDYLKYIPYNQKVLKMWALLENAVNSTTSKSYKGLFYRMLYKFLCAYVNLTYKNATSKQN